MRSDERTENTKGFQAQVFFDGASLGGGKD